MPPSRLDAWLATVLRAVRPGGTLVIVDEYAPTPEDEQIALADIYARRPFAGGRTFTIVKVFYDLADLHTRLADQDVDVAIHKLDDRFFLLHGRLWHDIQSADWSTALRAADAPAQIGGSDA